MEKEHTTLERTLDKLYELKKYDSLRDLVLTMQPEGIAEYLEHLSPRRAGLLFRILPKDPAAEVFAEMSRDQQLSLIEVFTKDEGEIFSKLKSDRLPRMAEEMPAYVVKRIIRQSSPEEKRHVCDLLQYPVGSTGRYMTEEYIDLRADMTAAESVLHIRSSELEADDAQGCYVLDETRKLLGTVSIKAIVFAPEETLVGDLMKPGVPSVHVQDPQKNAARLLTEKKLAALPVVDREGKLVGILSARGMEKHHRPGRQKALGGARKAFAFIPNLVVPKTKTAPAGQVRQITQQLMQYSAMEKEDLFYLLDTAGSGLSQEDVREASAKWGKNVIDLGEKRNFFQKLADVVINPFNLVLFVVLLITFCTDVLFAQEKSWSTSVLILSMIAISAIIGYTQQEKSNLAAGKLRRMIENNVDVLREGEVRSVLLEDVVPGDIVKLSSGDMLPGDVRFLTAKDLFVDQATLTGESAPVEKYADYWETEYITDLSNIGFMGTDITSGSATAVVIATGAETYFGSMAKTLSGERGASDFENGINQISKLLIKFMLVMVPVIFIANILTKNNVLEAVLFSITISIGLIPEMLPVIMTSTLAKGAVEMAKKKTIVKRLASIQSFGEMDVLCTDKTGTLTEDEIVLEKYMDVDGNEDRDVLRHAFLNSYFQTGLKNAIDLAIIRRGESEGLTTLRKEFVRRDEIPFDFTRRRMSVVVEDSKGDRLLVTKGAADEILSCCDWILRNGALLPLTEEEKKKAQAVFDQQSNDGLRMVAVAEKHHVPGEGVFGVQDEKEMILMGFVGFLDPPKKSSREALESLKAHGIRSVVLTGDAPGVARCVCEKLGLPVDEVLTGSDIEAMSDEDLCRRVETCALFCKLSPYQKRRVVTMLQQNGHTVGYMGDGINDAPPLRQANVGISVDSAVDIAKEVADIILLEKDLRVLDEGVVGGRKTFVNLTKYIKMATSGNFGNMFSVVIASVFLPFLPLLPVHILIQNLLNDFAQLGMPWDNVDEEYLQKPKKLNIKGIRQYMFYFGSASVIADVLCFLVLWFFCGFNSVSRATGFQTGWFLFGILSQTLIIHMIRTQKVPFVQSKPSRSLLLSTGIISAIALLLGFTKLAGIFRLVPMPPYYLLFLVGLIAVYVLFVQILKPIYTKKFGEWI